MQTWAVRHSPTTCFKDYHTENPYFYALKSCRFHSSLKTIFTIVSQIIQLQPHNSRSQLRTRGITLFTNNKNGHWAILNRYSSHTTATLESCSFAFFYFVYRTQPSSTRSIINNVLNVVMANCHQLSGCQATTDAQWLPSWMVTIIRIAKEAEEDERNSNLAQKKSHWRQVWRSGVFSRRADFYRDLIGIISPIWVLRNQFWSI